MEMMLMALGYICLIAAGILFWQEMSADWERLDDD